jgi:hypothetical protein
MKNRQELNLTTAILSNDNCDNPLYWGYYANLHQITEADYNAGVDAFFAGGQGDIPAAVDMRAITLDTEENCITHHIQYYMDAADITTNNEILVHVKPIPPLLPHSTGRYSLALFRGIKAIFNPDKFHFSKSIGNTGAPTLAFYATGVDNIPLYFGDLSGLFP